jgi:hypothetical protein
VSSDADDHISPTRTALPSRVRLGVPSQSHRDLPIRARIHRPTSCFLARAPAMSARTLGAATRADPPVQNTHRPRGKLGVPGRSHQDLPIRAEKHRSARRSFVRARAAAPHSYPVHPLCAASIPRQSAAYALPVAQGGSSVWRRGGAGRRYRAAGNAEADILSKVVVFIEAFPFLSYLAPGLAGSRIAE